MSASENHDQLVKTARVTGIWYLAMAIAGIIGFMIFHPQLFVTENPEKTLTNLTNHESLSRIRLLLELVIIVSQALTAVWFYKLFKHINEWAAWAVGIWGMMNSAAIMISAIAMSSAIEFANSAFPINDEKIALIQLLQYIITHAWGVGSLFFGLWLIPMGYIIITSKRMPIWLGRTLIIGGIAYILGTVIKYIGIEHSLLELLVIPATIGEFWMIGYLLIFGILPLHKLND